jgi:hypothetical protein
MLHPGLHSRNLVCFDELCEELQVLLASLRVQIGEFLAHERRQRGGVDETIYRSDPSALRFSVVKSSRHLYSETGGCDGRQSGQE